MLRLRQVPCCRMGTETCAWLVGLALQVLVQELVFAFGVTCKQQLHTKTRDQCLLVCTRGVFLKRKTKCISSAALATTPLVARSTRPATTSFKFCTAAEPLSPLQKSLSNSEALALLSVLESSRQQFRHQEIEGSGTTVFFLHQNTHVFVQKKTRIEPFHLLLFLVVLRHIRLVELETTLHNAISDLAQDP